MNAFLIELEAGAHFSYKSLFDMTFVDDVQLTREKALLKRAKAMFTILIEFLCC